MTSAYDRATVLAAKPGEPGIEIAYAAGGFAVLQIALHMWAAVATREGSTALLHGIAFLCDLLFLAVTVKLLELLQRSSAGRRRRVIALVAKVTICSVGVLLASYPLLLTDFLNFPVNVFAVDWTMTGFFIANLLGRSGVVALLAAVGVGLTALQLRRGIALQLRPTPLALLAITCLLGAIFTGGQRGVIQVHPHPLVYSTQETIKSLGSGRQRVVPSPTRPSGSADYLKVRTPSPLATASSFRYEHVFLVVMETVNAADFAKGFLELPAGFHARMKDHAAYFSQYYTTNLDSYTSLLAMLTSMHVPYRAYVRPDYFANVNNAPSMTQSLREHGWASLFVCTAEHQPFVPLPEQWTVVLHGRDLSARSKWVTLRTNPVEAGIEDRAAIPAIVEFVRTNSRSLVMHELLIGHSPRWTKLTGKSQLPYYDEYLQELFDCLEDADLARSSLLILVADHGSRRDSTVAENYHVPLLIVGEGVEPCVDSAMYSHLDLQHIIAKYLCGLPAPEPRDNVLVVGHSARWVYGEITSSGEHLFLDALEGEVLSRYGKVLASQVFDRLQDTIDTLSRY